MLKQALFAGLMFLLAASVQAADAHFEWGIAAGGSKVTVQDSKLAVDFKANGFVLNPYIGYQFMPYLAVEGGYIAGGKTRERHDTTVQIVKNDGWSLSGVGMWPINDTYSVHARLGYVLWDAKSTELLVNAPPESGSSGNVLFGIGGGYMLGDVKLRLEYQRSSIDSGKFQMLTLGFVAYL